MMSEHTVPAQRAGDFQLAPAANSRQQKGISFMVTSSAGDLRNFAIVGHASSGKTTLTEAMLACAGVIGRMGNIAQGTTVSDYHFTERQHQISTQTSLMHCTWMGKKLNILDTPGYLDFIIEALEALRVVDFSLLVGQAPYGIGCDRAWL